VPRFSSLVIAAAFAFLPASTFAKTNAPASPEDIRKTLAAYVRDHPNAMIAVGILRQGNTQTYFVRGSQERDIPLDDRTLFEIGSVTKTFTGTLLAQMVQSGEVRLDDPIQKYLPPRVVAPTYNGIPITFASLAEHRSGLPAWPPNVHPKDPANPYAGYTAGMLYSALDHYKLTQAPGAHSEYSNFAYALLGQILSNRMQKPWGAMIEQHILQPLGMRDTVCIGSTVSKRRLAPAYLYDGRPQVAWDFGALSPAGSIESDLHDMLIFLRANMNAPAGPLGRAMYFAQRPRVLEDKDDSVGFAWDTDLQHGFVYKAGGTGGYSTEIMLDRRAAYGMVFLANLPNSANLGQVAAHIILPASNAAPTEWGLVKKELSPYSGDYPVPGNVPPLTLTIFKYKGQLFIETTQTSPEKLVSLTHDRYSWESIHAILTFDRDKRGNVTGLSISQNGQITRVKRSARTP
jgi:CubicO group peptidase (beta-lactamase class C family)